MKPKSTIVLVLFTVLALLSILCTVQVCAEPTVSLKLHKDFGYSSFGNDAQGNWTAQATCSGDTVRVEFYLDNQLQLNDTQAPYAWSYYTNNYSEGTHTIQAIAFDADGNQASASKEQNFVTAPTDFIFGIIIAVVVIVLIAVGFFVIKTRARKKQPISHNF
jgi:hypothetical protein